MLLIKIILILLFLVIVYQNFKINSLEDDINEIEKELVVEESFFTLTPITKKVSIIKILKEELKMKSDELDRQNKLIKHLEKYLGITYVKRESKTEGYEKSPTFLSSGYTSAGLGYMSADLGYMSAGSGGPDISTTADVCEKKKKPKKVAKKSKKK